MPNHVHMILVIANDGGRMISAPTEVSKIIGYFKQYASRTASFSIWQKSFHDHIIRDEDEYHRFAEYIENNPLLWEKDCYFKVK
jgi:REP element-mobilizing transposase RayT